MPYSELEQNEEILRFLENERQQEMYENEIEMEIVVERKTEENDFWTLYEEHIRPFELSEPNFDIQNDLNVQIGWYSEDRNPIDS